VEAEVDSLLVTVEGNTLEEVGSLMEVMADLVAVHTATVEVAGAAECLLTRSSDREPFVGNVDPQTGRVY
jgi:hypothetical protein